MQSEHNSAKMQHSHTGNHCTQPKITHHGPNNDQTCNTSHPVFPPSPTICPPKHHPSPPRTKPTKSSQLADAVQIQVGPIKTNQPAVSANHQFSTSDQATFPHLKHNILTIFTHDLSYKLNETKRLLADMHHRLDKYLSHCPNTRTINNNTPSPAPSINQLLHESNPILLVQQPMHPQNLYDLISTIPLVPYWYLQKIPAINHTK